MTKNMTRRDFLKTAAVVPFAVSQIAKGEIAYQGEATPESTEEFPMPQWVNNISNEKARNIISQIYKNLVDFGVDPEAQTVLLAQSIETGNFDELLENAHPFQTGFVIAEGGDRNRAYIEDSAEAAGVSTENPTLMLASSSKPFLVDTYFKLLEGTGMDMENGYTLDVPMAQLGDIKYRIDTFGGEKTFEELFPGLDMNQPFAQLDVDQIVYCILTLSTNGILDTLKADVMLIKNIGEEALAEEIQKIAPHFRARVGTGTGIIDGYSNESSVEQYAQDKRAQIEDLLKDEGFVSQEILKGIKNNKAKFGFDFTNSDLGKDLIAQGCEIFEKTGSYENYYWNAEQAEQGFPPHAIFLTTVTVKFPNGELRSFVYYEVYQVPFSPVYANAPGNVVDKWPDEEIDGVIRLFIALGNKISPDFVKRMNAKAEQILVAK